MTMFPDKAALVVIDVQMGFLDPSWGDRNNPEAETNVARLIAAWRALGWPIHHVQHASRLPDAVFFPGTPGFSFKPEALPAAGEPVHVKSVNSGFIGTGLEDALRADGVDTVVVAGLTTPHCVSTTTRMAGNLGFKVYLVEDATAAFALPALDGTMRSADQVHLGALSDLSEEFATIVTTDDVLLGLDGGGGAV